VVALSRDLTIAGMGLCATFLGELQEARSLYKQLGHTPVWLWRTDPFVYLFFIGEMGRYQPEAGFASLERMFSLTDQIRENAPLYFLKNQLLLTRFLAREDQERANGVWNEVAAELNEMGLQRMLDVWWA